MICFTDPLQTGASTALAAEIAVSAMTLHSGGQNRVPVFCGVSEPSSAIVLVPQGNWPLRFPSEELDEDPSLPVRRMDAVPP
jgi:hypothetical protein